MYLIRYPIWLGQGYFRSTQAGFERQAKHFEPHVLDVSLVGKVAVVTGVMVHMVYHDWERASKAREEILEEAHQEVAQSEITDHLENNLIIDQMSLDNLPSIRVFIEKFANQPSSCCDILVNNAGGLLQMVGVTPEGIQHTEGVDTIIWAAVAKAAWKVPNGSFLEDHQVTRQNLPFCWTQTQPGDPERLYTQCHHYATKVMGDAAFEPVNLTGPLV
ncbi:Dehydrogenase/reductase SDR member 12 [Dimargaris cristalligena]|nr:Dehydrogenase/reductase SDR member 12 [Dimargaris cristalligena]